MQCCERLNKKKYRNDSSKIIAFWFQVAMIEKVKVSCISQLIKMVKMEREATAIALGFLPLISVLECKDVLWNFKYL